MDGFYTLPFQLLGGQGSFPPVLCGETCESQMSQPNLKQLGVWYGHPRVLHTKLQERLLIEFVERTSYERKPRRPFVQLAFDMGMSQNRGPQ